MLLALVESSSAQIQQPDRENVDVRQDEWRSMQEQATRQLQVTVKEQVTSMNNMQAKMNIQGNVIAELKKNMEDKDIEILELRSEKEDLIAQNDRLKVSANRAMKIEIDELKMKLKDGSTLEVEDLKEQLKRSNKLLKEANNVKSDLQQKMRDQMKATENPVKEQRTKNKGKHR